MSSLVLAVAKVVADVGKGLGSNDEDRSEGGLAVADEAVALNLLELDFIGVEDMLLAGLAYSQGKHGDLLGVTNNLVCGLLDNGELLVESRERLVTEIIGLLDVWRDILEWLREVGDEGSGEGAVCGVGQLQ